MKTSSGRRIIRPNTCSPNRGSVPGGTSRRIHQTDSSRQRNDRLRAPSAHGRAISNTAGRNTMHTLAGPSDFPTTRWTLVIAAADTQRKDARSALVSLCEGYWYPLYAYIRRRGYPADQAQDLTQEF